MARFGKIEVMAPQLKTVAVLAAVSLLMGCARLEVTVDVLNPELVEPRAQEDFIENSMQEILAEDSTAVSQRFLEVQNAHYAAYVAKIELLNQRIENTEDEFEKEVLGQSASDLDSGFRENIVPVYQERESAWLATTSEIRRLYDQYESSTDPGEKARLRKRLVVQLESRSTMIRQLLEFVNYDLDKMEQTSQDSLKAVRTDVAEKSKQLFDSGGLLHSRYTYYVVKADDEEWADYYDRSFGRGTFGNTDIAIKALGPGNFTVKGLSFNPADVATAASKVTTQAVLLAAQIYGVPVNIEGTPPTGDGAELAKSSSRVSSAFAAREEVAASIQDQRAAMLRLSRAILDESDILENGTDEQRRQSIAAITAVYNSQIRRLNVSAPDAGGTNGN